MDTDALLDISKLKTTVVENLNSQWADLIAFLPNLLGAVVILLVGLIIAFILKKIGSSLFRKIGIDRVSRNAGVSDVMQDAGLARRPSLLAGKIIFWLVLFIFLVPAANTLGLTELVNLFKGVISFLPKIITALVIVIFGIMFAQFLRRSIIDKPSTIGSDSAKSLGNLIYGIMVTVIVLVALEQLEIETKLLHSIIMIVVSGIMLALAFSVGFGAREVAHNLLSGIYAREHFKPGEHVEIDDVKGNIQEVSTLNTIIELSDNETVSIPNSTLYKSIVKISH
ncbi:mechanosensitive ion channel [Cocleimonas sp. KMM 6892]|uniref:mechanosensitive ion channel family protein n=1 Tax=unclassified Cocleimonas TaxID=2639732 RepID=UPI002DBB5AA7|nr:MULTISPECIES: mechanosensitive ion channel domain-containing protein [unclassified Cocleimonas]MEB8431647.1 mechanosensitive ion channel [Cocleimonas sp. KMM 6892]MEC4713581.1 mechanosensitive ion channel [Cocleimonas sp. KMM 6895]MEC4742912.1 mechanosensitive ion channel [Cocleimonas sp. KMM 6896]